MSKSSQSKISNANNRAITSVVAVVIVAAIISAVVITNRAISQKVRARKTPRLLSKIKIRLKKAIIETSAVANAVVIAISVVVAVKTVVAITATTTTPPTSKKAKILRTLPKTRKATSNSKRSQSSVANVATCVKKYV